MTCASIAGAAAAHTSSSDAFSTSTEILPAIRSRRYGCSLPLSSASSSSGHADQHAIRARAACRRSNARSTALARWSETSFSTERW